MDAFKNSDPTEVVTGPGDRPHSVAYRVRIFKPCPTDLQVILGDAIHNLRSAMDAVTYDLAVRHLGTLSPEQEKSTQLPICRDSSAFEQSMNRKKHGQLVAQLYGPDGVAALRSVQPFALPEERAAMGIQQVRTAEQDFQGDALNRLNLLWNLDKHRRLPDVAWFFQIIYWGAPAVPWRPAQPNRSLLNDNDLLGHFDFATAESVEPIKPIVRLDLTFVDDSSPFSQSALELLERWHQLLSGWVIPRVFITATSGGQPPPMVIPSPPGGWPA